MTTWPNALRALLDDQCGVVSRRQLLAAGLAPHDVKRLQRRRELTPIHPGVYVDHTGSPTWIQHAWAGVLALWPAALTHESALRAAEGPGSLRDPLPIRVAVERHRHVAGPSGVIVLRRDHLEERVLWHLGPPRFRYEEAALDVAVAAPTDLEALAEVARVVQGRRTTASRLLGTLERRAHVGRRDWLCEVLADVARGTSSVLEHAYRRQVEAPHGLGFSRRQVRERLGSGVVYRDVRYDVEGAAVLVVELDGRLHHDTARARDRDFDRDLDTAVAGVPTVRLSYRQVVERPCRTAARIAALLELRGWRGHPRACGPECDVR